MIYDLPEFARSIPIIVTSDMDVLSFFMPSPNITLAHYDGVGRGIHAINKAFFMNNRIPR